MLSITQDPYVGFQRFLDLFFSLWGIWAFVSDVEFGFDWAHELSEGSSTHCRPGARRFQFTRFSTRNSSGKSPSLCSMVCVSSITGSAGLPKRGAIPLQLVGRIIVLPSSSRAGQLSTGRSVLMTSGS